MSWLERGPDLEAEVERLVPRLREIRHDLHRHPELGFEEHRTHKVVHDWLTAYGYAPATSAETGLVADLRPDLVGRAPTIALRADLDCLPMHETTDLPHRSVHDGRAHKCGHDGHTAILMGVAQALASHRKHAPGNVRLLFQPAEEGVRGGGAQVMVAEGVLDEVAEVYGLHNWPPFPAGQVRVRPGPMMAQTHKLTVDIVGRGGHGSEPQACRDPIVAAAHVVVALQTVVARGLGHHGGAVVSVCSLNAGSTDNVIPERARLLGTVRTFSDSVTTRVLERIHEIVDGTARTFGVEASLELGPGYPVLSNDDRCAEAVATVASELLGVDAVSDVGLPIAGGEDFAYFALNRPSAYFLLGAGRPGQDTPGCHHPDFDFDDELLAVGIRLFLGLCRTRLVDLATK